MLNRMLRVLGIIGLFLLGSASTWAISWGVQYICALTIPGQKLDITSAVSNRLALLTVISTIIIMVTILLGVVMDSCSLFLFGCGVTALLGYLARDYAFQGTVVAATPAKVAYCVGAVIWGILMWYIFLRDVTARAIDAH